jgi:hypothetical protein
LTNRYRIGYSWGLASGRLLLWGLVVVLLAGCGSSARGGQDVERTFDVSWHERASQLDMRYATTRIAFHDGRWSARISVHNGTDKPMYETNWTPPDSNGFTWNGPALVFNGLDVLGDRRLIFFAADTETPPLPYPLRPGQTWTGTIGGRLPAEPRVPKDEPIWIRYPMFGIGEPWDDVTTSSAVQWLSEKSVQL